ncbi:MAG: hypothetical protein ACI9FR_000742 [Cryomorphaceae bacterium]|jgi:hypothetical protein
MTNKTTGFAHINSIFSAAFEAFSKMHKSYANYRVVDGCIDG